MCWVATLGGFAIAFFGFAVMLHGWPWPSGQGADSPKITDWLTSFGTIGATLLAATVPLYQNWDRRRERTIQQLSSEWNISEEVYRISTRLIGIAENIKVGKLPRSNNELLFLRSHLETAKQSVQDRFGRRVIEDLLRDSLALTDIYEYRFSTFALNTQAEIVEHVRSTKALHDITESLETLSKSASTWMKNVLSKFDRLGEQAPGVVKASGDAMLETRTSAEGRIQRQND